VVINSVNPSGETAQALQSDLSSKYGVPVLPLNILEMRETELEDLLSQVLYEFPLRSVSINVPQWIRALPRDSWLWLLLISLLKKSSTGLMKLRDYPEITGAFDQADELEGLKINLINPGEGAIEADLKVPDSLYYKILSESCGCEVTNEVQLMSMMGELVHAKREYDRIASALSQVRSTGYGVVPPSLEDMVLDPPQTFRQGGQFGVKLKATAPSWHIMQVDVSAEISPVLGTEQQSAFMAQTLAEGLENDPEQIWKMEFFGRELHQLIGEGINQKLLRMPANAQDKLRGCMTRLVNDGSGGLLLIFL